MSNDIIPSQPQVPQVLEVYDRISDPMEAVKALGASIFKSGLFGCDRPEQGEVLAMQCLAERKSPLELARTYHMVEGKLAIRADALLAKFHRIGGRVEWRERTDKKVTAIFSRPPQAGVEISTDIDTHVANGNAISGKTGKMKENWAKWPRQMLTARVISEGVRLIAPECCFGEYVFEEMEKSERRTYVPRPNRKQKLSEVIPDDRAETAVALLVKTGFLEAGQTLADLSAEQEESLANNPAFIQAVL